MISHIAVQKLGLKSNAEGGTAGDSCDAITTRKVEDGQGQQLWSKYEIRRFAFSIVDYLMKKDGKNNSRQAHRNVPMTKDVSSSAVGATEEELLLVAAGKMRLPKEPAALEKLLKLRPRHCKDRDVTQALLEERERSR